MSIEEILPSQLIRTLLVPILYEIWKVVEDELWKANIIECRRTPSLLPSQYQFQALLLLCSLLNHM